MATPNLLGHYASDHANEASFSDISEPETLSPLGSAPRIGFSDTPSRSRFSDGSGRRKPNGWLWSVTRTRLRRKMARFLYRRTASIVMFVLLACFFFMNWWMFSSIQDSVRGRGFKLRILQANSSVLSVREELRKLGKGKKPAKTIYARLLEKAAHSLAERDNKPDPKDLWVEPQLRASSWIPCAEQRNWTFSSGNNGYILISANGGINQQRVA